MIQYYAMEEISNSLIIERIFYMGQPTNKISNQLSNLFKCLDLLAAVQ
jgi:hypothetical protein